MLVNSVSKQPVKSAGKSAPASDKPTPATAKVTSKASALEKPGGAKLRQPTLRFYGDTFIFNTVSGMFYNVSPTASFMLRGLDAGIDPHRLADEVQRRYGIGHARAVRDIELLRNDFAALETSRPVRS